MVHSHLYLIRKYPLNQFLLQRAPGQLSIQSSLVVDDSTEATLLSKKTKRNIGKEKKTLQDTRYLLIGKYLEVDCNL